MGRRKEKPLSPAEANARALRRYAAYGAEGVYKRAGVATIRHFVRAAALRRARAQAALAAADPRSCDYLLQREQEDAAKSLHVLARQGLEYARYRAAMPGAYPGFPGDRPAHQTWARLQAGGPANPLLELIHRLAVRIDAHLGEVQEACRAAGLYHNGDLRAELDEDKLADHVAAHVHEARAQRKRFRMSEPAYQGYA